ncbi:DDE family transposase, partial [Paenibacillus taihuensis]
HKIKREKDIRKYTVPARGSSKFATLYSRRTAVERVFAYLKSYFGLTGTRKRKKRAFVEMDLTCLTYTLCKFALDKLNQELRRTRCAA